MDSDGEMGRSRWVIFLASMVVLMGLPMGDTADALEKNRANEPMISRIVIDVKGIHQDTGRWIHTVRNLIYIHEGEPFSAKKFQDSISALKASNIFKTIHVSETTDKEKQLILHFQVTPYPRVKDIRIYGGFPLLEREILNAMYLHPGRIYRPEKFPENAAGIVQLFKEDGYIAPDVELTAEKDTSGENYVVRVHIRKGDFFHTRRVHISGNRAFSAARLKWRLKTWKSFPIPAGMKRFKKKEFAKDIKDLIQFYRKKKYPEVKVTSSVSKDVKAQAATLNITIEEGPKYDIRFQGNTAFSRRTLKKDLVLYKEGNHRDLGLRRSIRKIKRRYREAGYKNCRIRINSDIDEQAEKPVRKVRFIIDEGAQFIVNSVHITGNDAIDAREIKKEILSKPPGIFRKGAFVSEILDGDERSVTALYLKKGYLNAAVTSDTGVEKDIRENKQHVDVTFNISEGARTRVASVTFSGLTALSESEALQAVALKKGSVFRSYMIRIDENTLSSMISEKGYPHVTVEGTATISDDKTRADVTYDVHEVLFVKMGEMVYTGNFRTRGKVLEDELELDSGAPFSLKKLLESQRNIRNINAFESVEFKTFGLKENAREVNLLVEAEEKKPYYVQFGLGYDTEKRLYGNLLGGDHNLFGLNKDLWASGEISEIGFRGDVGITDQRFLGTRITSAINLFGEQREEFNKEFGTRNIGGSVSFYRNIFKQLSTDLSFVYNYREQYLTEEGPIPVGEADQYQPRSILVTRPSLTYNSIDSYIRPRKGLYSALSVDISKGIKNSLDDFLKYRLEVRKYFTGVENLTFAFRGRAGHITPFGQAGTIPQDQLFFLGGTSDVRGFEQNKLRVNAFGEAVGGKTEILGNAEARIGLTPDVEFSLFYTTGSIQNALVDEGSDAFRSSAGIGLHYFTPIGPIGVYYGHKLDRKENESTGEFHFTLGFRF